jgi:hypothetical protein
MGGYSKPSPKSAKGQDGEQLQPESYQQISEDFEDNDEISPEDYSYLLVGSTNFIN